VVGPAGGGTGLARRLYERFLAAARADGRRVVKAITSPANDGSIRFHRAMGFTVGGPVGDYNGRGRDMVTFEVAL
jgi:L-amino acid N-acyltransferase YncA